MLLRSSSTPILGSLLASSSCSSPYFSESPKHGSSHNPLERINSDSLNKLSFHHGGSVAQHHLNAASFNAFSCQFSPTPAASGPDSHPGAAGGFRRVRSDGNLRDLAADDYYHDELRCPSHFPPPVRSGTRRPSSLLKSIPSFSFYGPREPGGAADVVPEEDEEEEEEEVDDKGGIERSITIGDRIGGEPFFAGEKGNAGEGAGASPLFLARGLGIDGGERAGGLIVGVGGGPSSGGGGGGGGHAVQLGNGGDQSDMEAYYKRMVEEDSGNALFLRNYAHFLYQSKGDPKRAEEYYSRAILAEPSDGEVLSQYARLIWELHRDRERASRYFEQAVQAAPQDSHVLAAYAGFLWETEDEHEGDDAEAGRPQGCGGAQVPYGGGALASANVR